MMVSTQRVWQRIDIRK